MTDRVIAWELPPVTPRQRDIQHTLVEFRADPTLPWTAFPVVPVTDPQQIEQLDVNAGTFEYQFTIFDVELEPGDPVIVSHELGFDPPGSVLNVTITDT